MDKFDVIIVGAGPAGIFAGYELVRNRPSLSVCIVEIGNLIKNRERHEVMSGVGGAGTFSDGKLHYTPVLSHEKMFHLYPAHEYQKYLDSVELIFTQFGVHAEYYPKNLEEAKTLADNAKKKGIKLFIRKAQHVGSDKLPAVIKNFEDFLLSKNVVIKDKTEVVDVLIQDKTVQGVRLSNGQDLFAKKVLLAPGRIKAYWLQQLSEKLGLSYTYEKVEVGVRVEFAEAVLKKHAELMFCF